MARSLHQKIGKRRSQRYVFQDCIVQDYVTISSTNQRGQSTKLRLPDFRVIRQHILPWESMSPDLNSIENPLRQWIVKIQQGTPKAFKNWNVSSVKNGEISLRKQQEISSKIIRKKLLTVIKKTAHVINN